MSALESDTAYSESQGTYLVIVEILKEWTFFKLSVLSQLPKISIPVMGTKPLELFQETAPNRE